MSGSGDQESQPIPDSRSGMSAEHRRVGWGTLRRLLLYLLAVAAVIAVGVGVLGGLELWWHLHRTTVAEVESMISQNLSPGASSEEVIVFLDSRGIDHGSVERVGHYNSVLLDAGFDPDTKIIVALIPDTSRTFISTSDIRIDFILDDDYRLQEYIIRERFTSF